MKRIPFVLGLCLLANCGQFEPNSSPNLSNENLMVSKKTRFHLGDLDLLSALPQLPAIVPPITASAGNMILEAQGNWKLSSGAIWHQHIAMVAPMDRPVSGVYKFDLRIVLHDEPGAYLTVVASNNGNNRLFQKKYTKTSQPIWVVDPNLHTRTTSVPVTLNLASSKQTISVRANVIGTDGKEYFVEIEFNINKNSSGSINTNWARDFYDWRASAWSTVGGYEREIMRKTPTLPLSEVYTFTFERQGDGPVGRVMALDKGHVIPGAGSWITQPASAGLILFSGPTNLKLQTITIDTHTLQNGWHMVQSLMQSGDTSDAVNKIWFLVQN